MLKRINGFALITMVAALASAAFGQASADVGIKANFAGGDVVAIKGDRISLMTLDGPIEAVLSGKTAFKKIDPANPTIKAAVDSALSEIAPGDKVLVTGLVAEDKKTLPAKTVYLMTKASISEKITKEQEDWRNRGTFGNVVSIDPATNAITVSVRGGMMSPARNVIVKPGAGTEFMRYSADSIEFSKAVKSKIGEIEKGDEIRVLGNRNADGSEVQAERIVSGSFRTTSGKIKSLNPLTGEIVISDVITKKDVTVSVLATSILKQFPAEMAQRLAQFQMMQAMGQGGVRPPTGGGQTPNQQSPNPPNPQTQRTPGQSPGSGQGAGGGMGAGMRNGLDDTRFPAIKIEDLKVGETIGVLSTKPTNPSKIRAIKLFSGVEPFIKVAEAQAQMGGGGRGGAGSGFTIPGLDGFGN